MKLKCLRRRTWVLFALAFACVLYHILIWNSKAFCDWFVVEIYPWILNSYGRLTGLFPFSVGEWMLLLGILLVIIWIVLWVIVAIQRKQNGCRRICRRYNYFFWWTLVIVAWIQTINCFTLYHTSSWEDTYYSNYSADERESMVQNHEILTRLWKDNVSQLNALAPTFTRDDKGLMKPISNKVLYEKCIQAMKMLGKEYPRLSGYYPNPKPIFFSALMSQDYTSGVFFPFSMEANYNQMMYAAMRPFVLCHEMAHLKGYIQEDEANYIAYLACIQSNDPLLQYSACLGVHDYLAPEMAEACMDVYQAGEKPSKLVQEDNIFLTSESWEKVEASSVFETETISMVSEAMTETSLKMNGVEDGMIKYSQVMRLLLLYEATQGGDD